MMSRTLLKQGAIVILLLLFQGIESSLIMGLDFGSQNFKVSIAKPGSVDIALDEASSRKTRSLLGFDANDNRFFGDQAGSLVCDIFYYVWSILIVIKLQRTPERVITNPLQILGRKVKSLDEPWLQNIKNSEHMFWLNSLIEDPNGDEDIVIKMSNKTLAVDTIVAQILKKAQTIAKHHTGENIRDISIAVPAHFSHAERAAMINAAKIAGLNVITLVDQGLATAVSFAADKKLEKSQKILFFDFGGSNLQLSLFDISNEVVNNKTINNIRHIASDVNTNIGGQLIDRLIVEHWIKEIISKGLAKEISPRIRMRMLDAARKSKEILSVNKEAHAFVENISPDVDFKTVITKEELETICAPIWDDLFVTLKNFVAKANVSVTDIDDVQLFGASTRIPIIQETITKFYGHEPSRQLNTDESVAIGAALYAAEVSGMYRVKFRTKYGSHLSNPVKIDRKSLAIGEETQETYSSTIFTETSHYGSKRILKLPTEKDSIITLSYVNPVETPGTDKKIGEYLVTGLEGIHSRYNVTDKIVVHYKVELTTSGTVQLSSVEAHVPIVTQKTVRVKKIVNETTTEEVSEEIDGESPEKKEEDDSSSENEVNSEEDPTDNEEKETEEVITKKEPKIEYEEVVQEQKTVKVVSLKVRQVGHDNITKIFKSKKTILDQIEKKESDRFAAESAKSSLESFVYTLRDNMDDERFIAISTEVERQNIRNNLNVVSEWLDDEGFDQPADEYQKRHDELATLLKLIHERHEATLIEENLQLQEDVETLYASSENLEKSGETHVKDEL